MPIPFLRRLCLAALSLAAAMGAAASGALAQASCPAGQHRVCVLACFCAPGSREEMGEIYDSVGRMAASGLEAWLLQARSAAAAAGVQPIPLHIRARLEHYFDTQVLETVRYRVGDAAELDAANAMLHNPNVAAVTLVDIIVFRSAAAAEDDVALWAHELKHVEQYLEWGVAEFARRYTSDFQSVEAPGYEMQRRVAADLKAAEAAQP
ncbi:DUF4157 domain-containing protein [Pseudomonas stutzeri]|nr:DUF4157 domain-containing protein [Stutzerimonas stutzeri]